MNKTTKKKKIVIKSFIERLEEQHTSDAIKAGSSKNVFVIMKKKVTPDFEYEPGWYFVDEGEFPHGPFSTCKEANQLLQMYCESL